MSTVTILDISHKDCKICPYHWLLPGQFGCDIHCDLIKRWTPQVLPANTIVRGGRQDIRLFSTFQNNVLLLMLDHVSDAREKQRMRHCVESIFLQKSTAVDDGGDELSVDECYAQAQTALMQSAVDCKRKGGELVSANTEIAGGVRTTTTTATISSGNVQHKKRRLSTSSNSSSTSADGGRRSSLSSAQQQSTSSGSKSHHSSHKNRHHGRQKRSRPNSPIVASFSPLRDEDSIDGGNSMSQQQDHESSSLLNQSTDSVGSILEDGNGNTKRSRRNSTTTVDEWITNGSQVVDLTIHHEFDKLLEMTSEDMILPNSNETTGVPTEPVRYNLKNFLKHGALSSVRDYIIYATDADIVNMNNYLMDSSTDSPRPRVDVPTLVKQCIDLIRWMVITKHVKFIPYGIISLLSCSGKTIEGKYLQEFFTEDEHGIQLLSKKNIVLSEQIPCVLGDDGEYPDEISKMCRIIRQYVSNAQSYKRKQKSLSLKVKKEKIISLSQQQEHFSTQPSSSLNYSEIISMVSQSLVTDSQPTESTVNSEPLPESTDSI